MERAEVMVEIEMEEEVEERRHPMKARKSPYDIYSQWRNGKSVGFECGRSWGMIRAGLHRTKDDIKIHVVSVASLVGTHLFMVFIAQ